MSPKSGYEDGVVFGWGRIVGCEMWEGVMYDMRASRTCRFAKVWYGCSNSSVKKKLVSQDACGLSALVHHNALLEDGEVHVHMDTKWLSTLRRCGARDGVKHCIVLRC